MVISKYKDLRAQIQEQTSGSSVSDASSRTCSQMPLDLPRKLPPAPGQPCGQREAPECPASGCSRLPVVFSYFCTFGRLVSAPPRSGCPLWISVTTLHHQFYFTFVPGASILIMLTYISLSFLFCLSCPFLSALFSLPFLVPSSSPMSHLSLLFSPSCCKTNICRDCIAHARLYCSCRSFFVPLSPPAPILFTSSINPSG